MESGAIALYNSNTYMYLYGSTFDGNTEDGEGSSINVGYSSPLIIDEGDVSSFDVEVVEGGGTVSYGEVESDLLPPPEGLE